MSVLALALASSPGFGQAPPSLSIERQALLAAEPELGPELRAQIDRWARDAIRPNDAFADRYYRDLPRRIIEEARNRADEIDRIRRQSRGQSEDGERAAFVAELTGNSRLQRLISFLRLATPGSTSEDITGIRQDLTALVYDAVRNTNDHFSNRLREELQRPDAASPLGRERIEALLNSNRSAVETYLQAGAMRGLDPSVRQAFVGAGTRALAEQIHQEQRLTADMVDRLTGRVAAADARMNEIATASREAVAALDQVARRVDAHGRHVGQLATALVHVAQTTNARLDGLSGQIRANSESIDFILEASMGRLSPARQVALLDQGLLPNIPNRDDLLQTARDAQRAERESAGARRWSERFGAAASVAGAIASLGDALGLSPGQRQSLRDIQKGLLVAQSVTSTYAAVTTAAITGGPLQIGLAVFQGVGEIGNLTGAAAPTETEVLLSEMRGLFGEVFRQLEIINQKLDSLIRGQEAILRGIQDLGRRLDEIEENLVWEVRSIGTRLGDISRVVTDTLLARGIQACDSLISQYAGVQLNIQMRYEIFSQNTVNPRVGFNECELALQRGGLFGTAGAEFRVDSLFLFGTWWPASAGPGLPPPGAPIEIDREYYRTMLEATMALLGEREESGCRNRIFLLLSRGDMSFGSLNHSSFRCSARAQAVSRSSFRRLLDERVLPEQIIQFSDRIQFIAPFYTFADIENGRWRPLPLERVISRVSRGSLPFQRQSTQQAQAVQIVQHPGATYVQAFLETLDVGIAQEGILAGTGILARMAEILVPWSGDGPAAPEHEPLGEREFWSRPEYVAAIHAERIVQARREARTRARQAATEARDRRAPEAERQARLDDLKAAEEAYRQSLQSRSAARAPIDENNLPRVSIERFNLVSFGTASPPEDGATPRQEQRCRAGIEGWHDLEKTHAIQIAGCLLRLNPLLATNLAAFIVTKTLEQRGISVASYSIAYSLNADFLMRRYLRGLPIARVNSPLGQVWVLYARDEYGGLITIPLPPPERHATGAIDFFPAMAALTARRVALRDLLISSVTDGGGNPDLNAAIWRASTRH